MVVIKPAWYDRFECLADSCPATCCADWKIEIDEASLDRYSAMKGDLGWTVKNAIDWMEGCFMLKNGRCVLCTREGLCLLQKELGEEALCSTCRKFPRHTEEYPHIRELSLSLSCPQAVVLVFENASFEEDRGYRTISGGQEETLDFGDFDEDLFGKICRLRNTLFSLLHEDPEDCEKEHAYRPDEIKAEILAMSAALQARTTLENPPACSGREILDRLTRRNLPEQLQLFEKMETIGPDWKLIMERMKKYMEKGAREDLLNPPDALERLSENAGWDGPAFSVIEKNLLEYFLYVYLPGASYDGDVLSKACLAVFLQEWMFRFLLCTAEEAGSFSLMDAAVIISRFSRQTEHSDENLNLLEEWIRGTVYKSSNP